MVPATDHGHERLPCHADDLAGVDTVLTLMLYLLVPWTVTCRWGAVRKPENVCG